MNNTTICTDERQLLRKAYARIEAELARRRSLLRFYIDLAALVMEKPDGVVEEEYQEEE